MLWLENDSPISCGVYRMKRNRKSRILMIIEGENPKRRQEGIRKVYFEHNKEAEERCGFVASVT